MKLYAIHLPKNLLDTIPKNERTLYLTAGQLSKCPSERSASHLNHLSQGRAVEFSMPRC